MRISRSTTFIAALALVAAATPAPAQETTDESKAPEKADFGGASTVSGELTEVREDAESPFPRMDDLFEAMQPWYDLKKGILEDTGLDFAFSYAALWQRASRSGESGDRDAASGVGRFFGSWTLVAAERPTTER
jgi:hypothetical protein